MRSYKNWLIVPSITNIILTEETTKDPIFTN